VPNFFIDLQRLLWLVIFPAHRMCSVHYVLATSMRGTFCILNISFRPSVKYNFRYRSVQLVNMNLHHKNYKKCESGPFTDSEHRLFDFKVIFFSCHNFFWLQNHSIICSNTTSKDLMAHNGTLFQEFTNLVCFESCDPKTEMTWYPKMLHMTSNFHTSFVWIKLTCTNKFIVQNFEICYFLQLCIK